jgi:hypothetical protein
MTDETTSIEPRAVERSMNRRRVLKVAVATAPAIATLPSGAALARSSNLIGATTGTGKDALGRTLCLDTSSKTVVDGMIDLGVPPSGKVTAIKERNYLVEARGSADPISEKAMCQAGGDFYYQSSGWQTVKVPKGIVVSATAMSSFAGSIYIKEV